MEQVTNEDAREDPIAETDTPSLAVGRAKDAALIPSVEGGGTGFGGTSPESVREDLTEWQQNISKLEQEFADQRAGAAEDCES